MFFKTSISRHFACIGVNATDLCLLGPAAVLCLGTGSIVNVLRHEGTEQCARDLLEMFMKTLARLATQSLRTRLEIPSGPAALCMLMFCSARAISANWRIRLWFSKQFSIWYSVFDFLIPLTPDLKTLFQALSRS